jgi:hypothetical protein
MANIYKGAGLCPFGTSIAGYGSVAEADNTKHTLYLDSNNSQQNCRAIDPKTGDYMLDDNDQFMGMTNIQQKVLLALTTMRNSSIQNNLGINLSNIQVIGRNFDYLIRNEINNALKDLINNKEILLLDIKISTKNNKALINILWKDLTTNTLQNNIL